jgi:hypothetical protein
MMAAGDDGRTEGDRRGIMRASRVAVALIAVSAIAVVGLAMTGRLPWVAREWSAMASALAAASGDGGAGDGGVADAGVDAATKVQAGPLSSAQLTAPLYHVTFLTECGAPPDMKVVIKASVNMGRAIEVQATTDPADPRIETCIEQATRNLRWPASKRTEKVTVRY